MNLPVVLLQYSILNLRLNLKLIVPDVDVFEVFRHLDPQIRLL